MPSSNPLPLWRHREIDDETGRPLRADVRAAGHKAWKLVCAKSREILGDAGDAGNTGDAADVLEASVRAVSRYLEKINITLNSADPERSARPSRIPFPRTASKEKENFHSDWTNSRGAGQQVLISLAMCFVCL